jgi:hypothetical protein
MRILLVSDLHYTLRQFDWLVDAAPRYDLVVVAGDLLDINSAVAVHPQSVVVLNYLSLLGEGGGVAVGSGNHDLTGPDDAGEQSALWLERARSAGVPTDGDSLAIDDTLITVCPWWDGPTGRERVERHLAADAGRRPEHWIWVPPVGPGTATTGTPT